MPTTLGPKYLPKYRKLSHHTTGSAKIAQLRYAIVVEDPGHKKGPAFENPGTPPPPFRTDALNIHWLKASEVRPAARCTQAARMPEKNRPTPELGM